MGAVTAPVEGSTAWPACTASVSMRISELRKGPATPATREDTRDATAATCKGVNTYQ